MRCPILQDLPKPPEGRNGWPWTEESPQLGGFMQDGSIWKKISIVTPSFNQGQYIEETIRSVLLQGYPNYEYLIIDGGSTDDTIAIIRKYEKWISYWCSEKDNGQASGINKGFKMASGDIIAWINSDDFYQKNVFLTVALNFAKGDFDFLYGNINIVNEESEVVKRSNVSKYNIIDKFCYMVVPQPACFWRYKVFSTEGYLDENYHYHFDSEYWIRCSLKNKFFYINDILSSFRLHTYSKTVNKWEDFLIESIFLAETYLCSYTIGLPYNVIKEKNNILGFLNERIGHYYLLTKQMKNARKYFIKSIILRKFRIQNIIILCYIIDTITYSSFGKSIQELIKRKKVLFNRKARIG